MTKEEFDKLEDKWQIVYLDGHTPIQMVSKKSLKEDYILWYDSNEYAHTTHYSRISLELSDFEKKLEELAWKELCPEENKKEFETCLWTCKDYIESFKAGYRKALEHNKVPSFNEAAKMWDLCDAYSCLTRNEGWTWEDAIKYIQEHWNDKDFNVNYEKLFEQ